MLVFMCCCLRGCVKGGDVGSRQPLKTEETVDPADGPIEECWAARSVARLNPDQLRSDRNQVAHEVATGPHLDEGFRDKPVCDFQLLMDKLHCSRSVGRMV